MPRGLAGTPLRWDRFRLGNDSELSGAVLLHSFGVASFLRAH